MKSLSFCLTMSLCLLAQAQTTASTTSQPPVLISGEITAKNAQAIFIPHAYAGQATVRYFLSEGSLVKPGDLILRIDNNAQNDIEQLEIGLQQSRFRAAAEQAKLKLASLEAEKNYLLAKTSLAKAEIDAALPRAQISALDFDKYQGEKERASRDLQVKSHALSMAKEALRRAQNDAELEYKKQQDNLQFQRQLLSKAEVRAEKAGVVVHAYSNNSGERIEQGSNAEIGELAGHVIGDGAMHIKAWAVEADRARLQIGMPVKVSVDALPGTSFFSQIDFISQAPEERKRWGKARYFQLDIKLPENLNLPLVAGMSVLLEPQAKLQQISKLNLSSANTRLSGKEFLAEGEIVSRKNFAISPPSIPYTWQYSLQQISNEGSLVKAGEIITQFQAQDLQNKINTFKSTLNEKNRSLDKLKLEHQEADKNSELNFIQAKAEAEKAARKASLPKELVRRVDYDKLVLEKNLQAELALLAGNIRDAEVQARKAERSNMEADINLNQGYLRQYIAGQAALSIRAPFAGIFSQKTSYSGEKFSTGSQIWLGMSVANLADPTQLFVRAQIPEIQTSQIRLGQLVQVRLNGANLNLPAKVSALGQVFHTKSQAQTQVVRDIELEFTAPTKDLKPGAMVQVVIPGAATTAASTPIKS